MQDEYLSIRKPSVGELKDRGSRFIAFAFPVKNEKEIEEALAKIRSRHAKARHHCYAWRLGAGSNAYRSNDDGEPSGTAGRPILAQIDKASLSDILVVVVRYFGGTLLGRGGLVRAYGGAAAMAIEEADVYKVYVEEEVELICNYAVLNEVLALVKHGPWQLRNEEYGDDEVRFRLSMRQRLVEEMKEKVKDLKGVRITVKELQ